MEYLAYHSAYVLWRFAQRRAMLVALIGATVLWLIRVSAERYASRAS
jgi:hypothetical protein